jgi:purine-binding chemotaxis protein CheW
MSAEISTKAKNGMNEVAGKYLTFTLGRESYGIAVIKVREIIRPTSITAVPQMPAFVKGVINLRGKIIPIVDLRLKFELPEVTDTGCTCIIVVQAQLGSGTKTLMGLIVDAVEEVINIAAADIEPTPDFGSCLDTDYILGMAKARSSVKTLLDIDKLLNAETVAPILNRIESQPPGA